jgi:hypothetical protein
MKKLLDTAQWQAFRERVAKEFESRCRGVVEDTRDAFLAVGVKPRA